MSDNESASTIILEDGRSAEVVEFKLIFGGTMITREECSRCGQVFTAPTKLPFNFCPYCGSRRA